MESALLQKRNQMIVALQQHSNQEVADSFADPCSCTQPFQATVTKLADHFGYDADTQGHIMLALDDLLAHKTSQVVRDLSVQLAQTVSIAQARADASEAAGYDVFAHRLSAYWRLLLLNDQHTARPVKVMEADALIAQSVSSALRQQAQHVRPVLSGLTGASLRPALW
ncbi:MAG: hypothetical protein NDJ24_00135 [Alphaproteobacteria bacterium]|nr:hypothetical protein [Alphaproteobacteria bacterium]